MTSISQNVVVSDYEEDEDDECHEVVGVHPGLGLAVRRDNVLGDLCALFDENGDQCGSDEAFVGMFQWRDESGYSSVVLDEYENTFDN